MTNNHQQETKMDGRDENAVEVQEAKVTKPENLIKIPKPSLRDQILAANSVGEVKALLDSGMFRINALNSTRRRWREAANRRIKELEAAKP